MNTMALLPTEENLIDCLCGNIVNRNIGIRYFYRILQSENGFRSIAIDGKWGSGKTFFVRQTQIVINALNESSNMDEEKRTKVISSIPFSEEEKAPNHSVAIYFDAWQYDNDAESILSLIYEITKQFSIEFSLTDKSVAEKAGSIAEAITGRNISGIIKAFKSEDIFTKFKEEKSIEEEIENFITGLLRERGNRLIIFIDELDRCKPSYTVQLLEQIKHYINDERITFVFSVNLEQLQHTIRHYYGNGFDANRYLDRFFELRIDLPEADTSRFCLNLGIESHSFDIVIKQVIKMYDLKLREITRLSTQAKKAAYEILRADTRNRLPFPKGKGETFIMVFIVPLLLGLKMTNVTKYDAFINGQDSGPLEELLMADKVNVILPYLINPSESFRKEEGKTVISQKECCKRLYEAIFGDVYSNTTYTVMLGEYSFSKESKSFALSAASMMTQFAELS